MSKSKSRKRKAPKRVLALPDLEQAKTAVLNSLTSASGQRTYPAQTVYIWMTTSTSEDQQDGSLTGSCGFLRSLGKRCGAVSSSCADGDEGRSRQRSCSQVSSIGLRTNRLGGCLSEIVRQRASDSTCRTRSARFATT